MKGITMKMKMLILLAAFAVAGYGCGQGGWTTASNETDAAGMEKSSKVSLSFAFPPDGGAEKSLISDATTHILVTATQWSENDLGELKLINTDKALVVKGATNTATFDLFPTWTRICAGQWKGDPNNMTSTRLETACTFGKLAPGPNTVALNMLRGTWTLETPFQSFSGVYTQAFAMTGKRTYSDTDHMDAVMDGDPGSYWGYSPYMDGLSHACYNNWGCLYEAMFNQNGTYQSLENGMGGYANFFSSANSNEPFLVVGSGREIYYEVIGDGTGDDDGICELNERCDKRGEGFAIGGFARKTDADGIYREERRIIRPGEYDYYYGGDEFIPPALLAGRIETAIYGKNGATQTASIVDPCQATITSGNQITGCAGTHKSVVMGDYTTLRRGATTEPFENYTILRYNYRVESKAFFQGANICYEEGMRADKDASGNTICYHHGYWEQAVYNCSTAGHTWDPADRRCEMPSASSGTDCPSYYDSSQNVCYDYNSYTTYVPTCWDGAYNPNTGRCEMGLQRACLGDPSWPDYPEGIYDDATRTCTRTDTGYLNSIGFTPVTLSGSGSLPSSPTFSAQ
jgi:hypothetical protein